MATTKLKYKKPCSSVGKNPRNEVIKLKKEVKPELMFLNSSKGFLITSANVSATFFDSPGTSPFSVFLLAE